LLADGLPVEIERLSDAMGRPAPEVDGDLARLPWVFRDDQNRVIGYGGAILLETPHRLLIDGRQLYSSCAGDALFLPFIFDGARVESTCPTTKEQINLTVSAAGVSDITPADVVMSYPLPGDDGFSFTGDLVSRLCSFAHFFASEEAAEAWTAKHEGAFPLSIEDGFTLAQWWAARLYGIGKAPLWDAGSGHSVTAN
jgi:alkylmercury lyase